MFLPFNVEFYLFPNTGVGSDSGGHAIVSHSAPVIINGDVRNVVMARSDEFSISYSSDVINGRPAIEFISEVLDGGERFLKMRLYKYDFQVGDYDDQC